MNVRLRSNPATEGARLICAPEDFARSSAEYGGIQGELARVQIELWWWQRKRPIGDGVGVLVVLVSFMWTARARLLKGIRDSAVGRVFEAEVTGYHWARLLTISMLLATLTEWPYGYYTILRVLVSAVSAYGVVQAAERQVGAWAWVLGTLAVVFNPIIPVHLDRGTWIVVDLIAAAILVCSLFAKSFRKRHEGHG
ncbi:MAG: DUF6804 family protein [Actinomycetes bacterium]